MYVLKLPFAVAFGLPCLRLLYTAIVGYQLGILLVGFHTPELHFGIGFDGNGIDNADSDMVAVKILGNAQIIDVGRFATGVDLTGIDLMAVQVVQQCPIARCIVGYGNVRRLVGYSVDFVFADV